MQTAFQNQNPQKERLREIWEHAGVYYYEWHPG